MRAISPSLSQPTVEVDGVSAARPREEEEEPSLWGAMAASDKGRRGQRERRKGRNAMGRSEE